MEKEERVEEVSLTEKVKAFLCSFEGAEEKQHRISGDNSLRDPPVPIPNTEVKPQHADGTWLATARESRSSPDSIFFGHVFACPFSFVVTQICQIFDYMIE